jgi:hypothetical protein
MWFHPPPPLFLALKVLVVDRHWQDAVATMTALRKLARCDEVEGMVQLLASDAGSSSPVPASLSTAALQ